MTLLKIFKFNTHLGSDFAEPLDFVDPSDFAFCSGFSDSDDLFENGKKRNNQLQVYFSNLVNLALTVSLR